MMGLLRRRRARVSPSVSNYHNEEKPALHTHVFFRSAPAHVKDKDYLDAQLK